MVFGLRLGAAPQVVVTTTPRPTPIIRALLTAPGTVVTRGRTLDNRANLAPGVVADLERRYGGTRLGRQELDGEVLTDTPGALWTWERIDAARVAAAPQLRRVVVAIDPAVSAGEGSDETGIVVCGIGFDGRGYVLEDASGKYSPDGWARRAVHLAAEHKADRIVAEVNNGGQLVEHTLRTVDRAVAYKAVHASRGKATRAEPVAALYEQARVSHLGRLDALESQMTGWDPSTSTKSPDRVDALVWALTELMVDPTAPRTVTESSYDF
jgi:predicted phage terminase large subunit-like protein